MKFNIRSSQSIQEVQQDFRQIFSHLRPEFYQHQHADSEGNPKKEQYLHHVQMQELGVPAEGLSLELEDDMRTSDFEQMMESSFGLHVQIFRFRSYHLCKPSLPLFVGIGACLLFFQIEKEIGIGIIGHIKQLARSCRK